MKNKTERKVTLKGNPTLPDSRRSIRDRDTWPASCLQAKAGTQRPKLFPPPLLTPHASRTQGSCSVVTEWLNVHLSSDHWNKIGFSILDLTFSYVKWGFGPNDLSYS